MPNKPSLRQILVENREHWDHDGTDENVRENFNKVTYCRTPALGAEVFVSEDGQEVVVPHTCKSASCPACGRLSSLKWVEQIQYELPAIPYVGFCFTLPRALWTLFQDNEHLVEALPALGAWALQDWVKERYAADIMILVVTHSFGKALLFKPHLHILASSIGLDHSGDTITRDIRYPKAAVMKRWRHAVMDYLQKALAEGTIQSSRSYDDLKDLLEYQRDLWWNIDVPVEVNKIKFIAYVGRYLRRPPIADYNLISHDKENVRFWTKNTKRGSMEAMALSPAEFLSRIADHVAGRYRHKVRYFGLLSPRSKQKRYKIFLAHLRHVIGLKPRQLRYADRVKIDFGRDPLHDASGVRMRWSRSVPAEK